ncbi:AMP-binding protein [Blastococcus saxobsidens]|uniref:Putative O-succinylbenzoate--CoA ligase (MenE) n=1 Tax=Blastococcus saxobsidens (strain DD2) TaxID=1146883 RepID=H6RKT5_BLASD|nr:AMP-binding protein [Blastococcus saxobsidens]CCG03701.1 putative O-succinylbenzoate--CoA ligase (menE) [Blastococcus saxobsidens DD2]
MTSSTAVSLTRRAEARLERLGDHDQLWFEGRWHRAEELAARARRTAGGFARLGVRPGDRVVLFMANCPEVMIVSAALWRAGAVVTPAMFLLSDDELRHVLRDSGAVAVVTTPEFADTVTGVADDLPVIVVGGGDGRTLPLEELESAAELGIVPRGPEDLAVLLYTGGTTGRSKGVALSHGGLDASGAALAAAAQPDVVVGLLCLPMAHVYGLLMSVAGYHMPEIRRSVVMRWFDPAGFLALVEQHRVQQTAFVPSMFQRLLEQPLEQHDLSSLLLVSSGGAPLPREVALEFERRVPSAEVREGYGCTETSSLISAQPAGARRLGSVGKPVAGAEVEVVDEAGRPVPPGAHGEIRVRGPVLMQGYWRSPEATAEAVRDGWFHTGDVGTFDEDGYLYVVDRIKDVIIRNGFNVYPRDVEDALVAHPEISAAAVVGRPDPRVGEEVVAYVTVVPGATLQPADVVQHARRHVSAAKYPREVHVVDAIPLTAVAKIDRKALRARPRS